MVNIHSQDFSSASSLPWNQVCRPNELRIGYPDKRDVVPDLKDQHVYLHRVSVVRMGLLDPSHTAADLLRFWVFVRESKRIEAIHIEVSHEFNQRNPSYGQLGPSVAAAMYANAGKLRVLSLTGDGAHSADVLYEACSGVYRLDTLVVPVHASDAVRLGERNVCPAATAVRIAYRDDAFAKRSPTADEAAAIRRFWDLWVAQSSVKSVELDGDATGDPHYRGAVPRPRTGVRRSAWVRSAAAFDFTAWEFLVGSAETVYLRQTMTAEPTPTWIAAALSALSAYAHRVVRIVRIGLFCVDAADGAAVAAAHCDYLRRLARACPFKVYFRLHVVHPGSTKRTRGPSTARVGCVEVVVHATRTDADKHWRAPGLGGRDGAW